MREPRTFLGVKRYQCKAAVAGLYKKAEPGGALDDQILYGQGFHVGLIKDGWAYGQVEPLFGDAPAHEGYIRAELLTDEGGVQTHCVSIIKAPIFMRADLKSPIVNFLSFGSVVCVAAMSGDYANIGIGYMHVKHLSPIGRLGAAYDNDPLFVATNYIGTPYVWGGKSGDGVDCSGLVQMCLWATGQDCPRDAWEQEDELGTDIEIRPDLSGLQRGDLVFWKGHVGIMDDAFDLLHANAHHMMTTVEPLNEAARRIEKSAGPITSIKRLK